MLSEGLNAIITPGYFAILDPNLNLAFIVSTNEDTSRLRQESNHVDYSFVLIDNGVDAFGFKVLSQISK